MEDTVLPEKTREKSIPTHTKLESLEFPRSSDTELVVPCNPSGYGFMLQTDKDGEALGLTASDINGPLRRINKLIDGHLVEKKVAESKDYNHANIFTQRILIALGLIFLYSMYLIAIYEPADTADGIILVPLGLSLIILIGLFVITIKAMGISRDFVDLDGIITKDIDKAIDTENKGNLSGKGVRMEKGVKFAWIIFKKR
jgi:hypothetical protein